MESSAQTVPEAWLRVPPGRAEAEAIERGAGTHGWPGMANALRVGAIEAYVRGRLVVAEAWANTARLAGADAAAPTPPPLWLLSDHALTAAYLEREQPEDDRAAAWRILGELRARDAATFAEYGGLALAVALVHDTPPPPSWPHWQVTEAALPRRRPEPAAIYDHFVALDRSGRALHRLARLDAAELRFLVDVCAPEAELRWAREQITVPLARLDATYAAVSYREDRIVSASYVWPGETYTLADILRTGGICVDQAYFATQVGKARGVPTLFFAGAGRDGRHAWFGYLGTGRRWRMDAGRYEDQRYVTGLAIDPQTWSEISDHELAFLSEGFRREKNAREAAIHAGFARWLREAGRVAEAEAAARAAVRAERRELRGWEELLALRPGPGAPREAVAREAATSLSSYPDLQMRYLGVVIDSLAARGETAEAQRLGRELARRFADKRGDLTVAQLARQLAAVADRPTDEQLKLYASLLRRFDAVGGTALWDEVSRPFLRRLVTGKKFAEAREALAITRRALVVVPGTQLDAELRELAVLLARVG